MMSYYTAAMPYNTATKSAHGCCHTSIEMTGRAYHANYWHAKIGQQTAHVTIGMHKEGFRHKGRAHREDRQVKGCADQIPNSA